MPFPGTVSSGRTTTGQDSQEGQLGTVIGRSVVPSGKMWGDYKRQQYKGIIKPTRRAGRNAWVDDPAKTIAESGADANQAHSDLEPNGEHAAELAECGIANYDAPNQGKCVFCELYSVKKWWK